jgi:molecular chaperone GrpE
MPEPGDAFEPGRHEAVTQAPVPGVESGAIGQALQAGYLLGERVIRPAKVLVSTGSPEPAGAHNKDDTDANL